MHDELLQESDCAKQSDLRGTAIKRITDVVFPLEDERAKKEYGVGSGFGKWIIIEREAIPERITAILVKEDLGF